MTKKRQQMPLKKKQKSPHDFEDPDSMWASSKCKGVHSHADESRGKMYSVSAAGYFSSNLVVFQDDTELGLQEAVFIERFVLAELAQVDTDSVRARNLAHYPGYREAEFRSHTLILNELMRLVSERGVTIPDTAPYIAGTIKDGFELPHARLRWGDTYRNWEPA